MKTKPRQLVGAALAFTLSFALTAFAQETPKAEAAPAAPVPPSAPTAPASPANDKSGLRQIEPTSTPAAAPAATEEKTEDLQTRRVGEGGRVRVNTRTGERVAVGHDVTLAKDEQAQTVVSIFGSATADGEVADSVVSILGTTRVSGRVGDGAIAVLGGLFVNNEIGGDAIAVLGSAHINSKVRGQVVAVMGNVELGPNADISGDVVSVGGKITRDPKAIVHGDVHNVGIGPVFGDHGIDWLLAWVRQCGMYGRMLWVGPHLEWAWALALGFLALYVVFALLFRGGVEKCVTTLETRPGSTIIASLLTILLSPVFIVLLCVTVVGVALVPFFAVGLLIATLFGKAVMLAWLGKRITKLFGDGPLSHPAFAVFIGGLIVVGLYMIPVVGLITYKVLKVLGLGVVVYTLIQGSKRDKPVGGSTAPMPMSAPAFVPTPAPAAVGVAAAGVAAAPMMSAGFGSGSAGVAAAAPIDAPAIPVVPAPPPVAVPATTLPRAGFWIRTGALLIDLILIGVVVISLIEMLPRFARPNGPQPLLIAMALYAAMMWKMKGTTIGGIVCGLKVIRVDGRPIDWATAWVRALSCFLSMIVAGLGFIWVVIDDDKQSWHDKIAGTTVVRAPKGMTLV